MFSRGRRVFNYAFLVVWLADAAWRWLSPASHETRTTGVSAAIHGFLFFWVRERRRCFRRRMDAGHRHHRSRHSESCVVNEARADAPAPGMCRFYYGWIVLGVAALAMVGTLPGRTQGLGPSPNR